MKTFYTFIVTGFLTALLFCAGCGNGLTLGKVEGTVTFDGQPLANGTIIFAVKGTRESSGIIENGVIRNVTTFKDNDGTPIGEAAVAIIALKEQKTQPVVNEDASPDKPSSGSSTTMGGSEFSIPIRYVNTETSGLTVTINKGVNKVKFDLTK
ncbi:MAG: hypothetical protein LBU65_10830 [Planctomycetaceae bacterium]|jgi:hypothetical protein|nr:hypothetical protein [Planctomycetaceae bacterium]